MAPDPVDEAVALHDRALAAWDGHRYPQTVDLCRRALDVLDVLDLGRTPAPAAPTPPTC